MRMPFASPNWEPGILQGVTSMKRLYRLEDQKMIAGICAGIADMFKVDPTLVRLAAVFLAVITGFVPVIAVYLVGWWIIPDRSTLPKED